MKSTRRQFAMGSGLAMASGVFATARSWAGVEAADKPDWESRYTDGKTPMIHHVHLTVANQRTEPESWRERNGAPQRPAELFGTKWFWYDDPDMAPALAKM